MFSRKLFVWVAILSLAFSAAALAGCGGGSQAITPEEGEQIVQEYEDGTLEETYPEYESGDSTEEENSGMDAEEIQMEECYAEAENGVEEARCVEEYE